MAEVRVAKVDLDELGRDPYYAAYLFRKLLGQDPGAVPADVEAAEAMFESLEEDDALGLVQDCTPHLETEGLAELAAALLTRDTRPRVRAAWVLAMGQYRGTLHRRAVREALRDDPSPRVKSAALASLDRMEEDLPLPLVKPYLSHADARVRANAVEVLVDRDLPGLRRALTVLLSDPAPRVAAAAALGLWRRGDTSLLRLATREEGRAGRLAYLWACARTGRDKRVREILEAAMESDDPAVRRMAAYGLPGCAPASWIERLVHRALAHRHTEVRDALLEGCERVDPASTEKALEQALAKPRAPADARPRYLANALSCLRRMPVVPSYPVVAPYLENTDPRVQANAIELVEDRLDLTGLVEPLSRALESPAPRVAANAAVALWKRGSTEAMAALLVWVRSSDAARAPSAAHALGRLGGSLAEQALREVAREGDSRTRAIAYEALARAA